MTQYWIVNIIEKGHGLGPTHETGPATHLQLNTAIGDGHELSPDPTEPSLSIGVELDSKTLRDKSRENRFIGPGIE